VGPTTQQKLNGNEDLESTCKEKIGFILWQIKNKF
jgi:hypothetical protein